MPRKQQNSIMGLCGLRNLGNTCYMNAGLQCLSHTVSLKNYFLDKKFEKEINTQNILGSKGRLVKAFGSLIHELWYGTNTTYRRFLYNYRTIVDRIF